MSNMIILFFFPSIAYKVKIVILQFELNSLCINIFFFWIIFFIFFILQWQCLLNNILDIIPSPIHLINITCFEIAYQISNTFIFRYAIHSYLKMLRNNKLSRISKYPISFFITYLQCKHNSFKLFINNSRSKTKRFACKPTTQLCLIYFKAFPLPILIQPFIFYLLFPRHISWRCNQIGKESH